MFHNNAHCSFLSMQTFDVCYDLVISHKKETVNKINDNCNLLHKSNSAAIFMQFIVYLHNMTHENGGCRFAILLSKRQTPLKRHILFYLILTRQNYSRMFLSLRTESYLLPEAGFFQVQELPSLFLPGSVEEPVFS